MHYPTPVITTEARNAGKAVNTIGTPLSAIKRLHARSEKRMRRTAQPIGTGNGSSAEDVGISLHRCSPGPLQRACVYSDAPLVWKWHLHDPAV